MNKKIDNLRYTVYWSVHCANQLPNVGLWHSVSIPSAAHPCKMEPVCPVGWLGFTGTLSNVNAYIRIARLKPHLTQYRQSS